MNQPTLSVIVCTYNREKYIKECLVHLTKQTAYKSKYEVLVINNNSTDRSEGKIKDVIQKFPETIFHYFLEKNQGHTYARNRGIAEAKGQIMSFIDDDAFVNKHYCEELIDYFEKHEKVSAIGGKIIPIYEDTEPSWMSKYLLPLVAALDMGDQSIPFRGTKFPIGANMAFRKSIFDKYGKFDINLGRRAEGLEGGDEKDMFLRLKDGNETIYYVPQVAVKHIIPPHRIEKDYIKRLAIGVGTSERKRISKKGYKEIIKKVISELVKSSGTIVLAVRYLFQGFPSKAFILVKFRFWVIKGYFLKS